MNEKRVHRLWKREHMQVPRKQHRKRRFPGGSENGCVRHRARYKNHVWSYDFVTDRTEDGRQLRLLVVIDEYTRECLAIEVGLRLPSLKRIANADSIEGNAQSPYHDDFALDRIEQALHQQQREMSFKSFLIYLKQAQWL